MTSLLTDAFPSHVFEDPHDLPGAVAAWHGSRPYAATATPSFTSA